MDTSGNWRQPNRRKYHDAFLGRPKSPRNGAGRTRQVFQLPRFGSPCARSPQDKAAREARRAAVFTNVEALEARSSPPHLTGTGPRGRAKSEPNNGSANQRNGRA